MFKQDDHIGFLVDNKLILDNEAYTLNKESEIYICHPYDLLQSGLWRRLQKDFC